MAGRGGIRRPVVVPTRYAQRNRYMSHVETARASGTSCDANVETVGESYNPWTVVNVVFHHLAAQGLHPVLGGRDPGGPATELLRALGIEPAAEGNRQISEGIRQELADLRAAMFED
jgi:hypothetical protein